MVLPLFVFGRCCCQVAVVAAAVYSSCWQMLLPRWLMACLPWAWMADVIAKVADGIATGQCFSFNFDVVVGPHPIYEADGIFLFFCLGMGH